ncbi:MAG: FGGY-family carbohydrate kinase [Acidobacteria bacterium]|nr:FGGY-family carbohydrate kinase [Acidobacteriota bacterium]
MAKTGDCIIAHDLGTSGNKAVLVDTAGRVIGASFHAYPIHYPHPDWAEQDGEDWWGAVTTATKDLLSSTGVAPERIAAVTFGAQLLGLVPMSASGETLRRPIIWLDSRAGDQARRLMRRFGGPGIFRLAAGATLSGKDGLPKLLWLKEREPEVYSKMACFLDVGGYLVHRCTGRMSMEWAGASAFGLDLKKKRWMAGLIRFIGFDPAKLPALVRTTDVVGPLTREAASACGLLEGTPVVAGTGDVAAAAVGAGAVAEGDGHLYLGTSGWISVATSRKPRGKHGIALIQSADPARNLIFGEMETAGACVAWLADQLFRAEIERGGRAEAYRAMDEAAASVPPGSGDLVFTPWMYGERAPISDTDVRAALFSLGADHTREHIVRAVFEGVAYNFRWLLENMERDFGVRLPALRVVGGGSKSAPWMRILSDVTGRPVETVRNPLEVGAVGAALTAAVGLGMHPDFESLRRVVLPAAVYRPRAENRATYDFLFGVYKDTYRSLKGLYHRIGQRRARQTEAARRAG